MLGYLNRLGKSARTLARMLLDCGWFIFTDLIIPVALIQVFALVLNMTHPIFYIPGSIVGAVVITLYILRSGRVI